MDYAIIFDLDGTLTDSEPAHEQALRAAVQEHNMSFSNAYFVRECIGQGDEECVTKIARDHGRSLDAEVCKAIIEHKLAYFTKPNCLKRITIFPGAAECVRCAAAMCPVALCSGSVREAVVATVDHVGIAAHFQTIVTSDDVRANKPDPAGYLLAAQRLGVEPTRVIAIEDSPTGVQAARAAGCCVLGVGHWACPEALGQVDLFVPTIRMVTTELLERLFDTRM